MKYSVKKKILGALLLVVGKLPLEIHYFNSRWITFLVENVIRYRVALVDVNLEFAFPQKSKEERRIIRHDFYRHLSRIIVEALWFGSCRNPERLRKANIASMTNPEVMHELYEKSGSVMILFSHFGNWELIGGIENYDLSEGGSCINESNFCVTYRALKDRAWDEILKENRFAPLKDRDNYAGYIESKSFVRYTFRHKDEKKIYSMNTDQRPYFSAPDFIRVNFLNREVNTMSGGASIARKFSMAVTYMSMEEDRIGHYSLRFIPICTDASQMSEKEIMLKYYELLEVDIKKQPHNYLWTHNRWG